MMKMISNRQTVPAWGKCVLIILAIDGSEPTLGIGDQKGILCDFDKYYDNAKFNIGIIPRYKNELPVAGSSDVDGYNLRLNMNPTGAKSIYDKEAGYGANLLLENGKAWDYTSNQENEAPLVTRYRVFDGSRRVYEEYIMYPSRNSDL